MASSSNCMTDVVITLADAGTYDVHDGCRGRRPPNQRVWLSRHSWIALAWGAFTTFSVALKRGAV